MKFRAVLVEAACMKQFANIVTTLSKLSKRCILRICEDEIFFIIPEETGLRSEVTVWASLKRDGFFNSYYMVGDEEKNEIYLELSTDMFSSSLSSMKSGHAVASTKIKLTDKISPCLTIQLELGSPIGHAQICIHDVPVTVIPTRNWCSYKEPPPLDYDMIICMPNMRIVKNVVDRMKKLSNRLTLRSTTAGTLTFGISPPTSTIETHFRDLQLRSKSQELTNNASKNSAEVTVDIKRYAHFLSCESINAKTFLCSIITGRMLHHYVKHHNFILRYYLNAVDD